MDRKTRMKVQTLLHSLLYCMLYVKLDCTDMTRDNANVIDW